MSDGTDPRREPWRPWLPMSMDEWQYEIGSWGVETFHQHDREGAARGALNHLAREVLELIESERPEEAADCCILLMQWAHSKRFWLSEAVAAKHAINKTRRWGPPDEQGVCQHE